MKNEARTSASPAGKVIESAKANSSTSRRLATLRAFASAFDVGKPALESWEGRFRPYLREFLELSIDLDRQRVGWMTRSTHPQLRSNLLDLLRLQDIPPWQVASFLQLAEYCPRQQLFVKGEFAEGRLDEISAYFKDQLDLDSLASWLESIGIGSKPIERLRASAARLGCRHVDLVGLTFDRERIEAKVYLFHRFGQQAAGECRTLAAVTDAGHCEHQDWARHWVNTFGGHVGSLSLSCTPGSSDLGFKLDVSAMERALVDRVARREGWSQVARARVDQLEQCLGEGYFHWAAFRPCVNSGTRVRLYGALL